MMAAAKMSAALPEQSSSCSSRTLLIFVVISNLVCGTLAASSKAVINFPESGKTDSRDPPTIAKLKQDLFSRNFAAVENLLRSGLSANASSDVASLPQTDAEGRPILHLAVLAEKNGRGSAEATQLLIDRGVDVNAVDARRRTALHVAAGMGNVAAAEVLVRNGADMWAQDVGGMTPLSTASAHCQTEMAAKLMEAAGDQVVDYIVSKDAENWTALHDAARSECTALVRLLLKAIPQERSQDIFSQAKKGWTPLSLASRYGFSSIVRLLVARATDVEQLYLAKPDGINALHLATWYGHKRSVEFLVERTREMLRSAFNEEAGTAVGRFIARADSKGWSPFHFAVRYDFPEIFKLLIEQLGEDRKSEILHASDEEGWSPLHMAARYGKLECMALLLRHAPGNIDAKKDFGWTPLLLAVFAGHTNATTFLVWSGAEAAIENDEGVDAFKQARLTCPQCERILDLQDALRSPLGQGCGEGHPLEKEKLQLKTPNAGVFAKADISSVPAAGGHHPPSQPSSPDSPEAPQQTPLLLLKQALLSRDIPAAISILDQTDNAVLSEPDGPDGIPVLHLAVVVEDADPSVSASVPTGANSGHDPKGITRILLQRGAKVDAVDKSGRTALHLASSSWKSGPAQALIDAGADIRGQDKEGFTPLMLAAASCEGGKIALPPSATTQEVQRSPSPASPKLPPLALWSRWARYNFVVLENSVLKILLDAAGDSAVDYILTKDKDNNTAIHAAAFSACVGAIEYFLKLIPKGRNADLYWPSSQGFTPLSIAAQRGRSTIVKLLAERAPSIDALYLPEVNGFTPLHYAVVDGHARAVEFLLEYTNAFLEDPDQRAALIAKPNNRGFSAFHFAAVRDATGTGKKRIDILQTLIDQLDDRNRDAVLHAPADNGMAPLHFAAFHGKVEHLMMLLATAPGNINSKSIRGLTPLMFAAAQGHANATALLIWNAADDQARDDEGYTAYDYAKENCPQCLSLLDMHKVLNVTKKRMCSALSPASGIATTAPTFVRRPPPPPPAASLPPATLPARPPPPPVPPFLRPGGQQRPPLPVSPGIVDEDDDGLDGGIDRPFTVTRPPSSVRPGADSRPVRPPGSVGGGVFFRPGPQNLGPAGNDRRPPLTVATVLVDEGPSRPRPDVDDENQTGGLFPSRPLFSSTKPQQPPRGVPSGGTGIRPAVPVFGGGIRTTTARPGGGGNVGTNGEDDDDPLDFDNQRPPSSGLEEIEETGGLFPNIPNLQQIFGIGGPAPNIPKDKQTSVARPTAEVDTQGDKFGIDADLGAPFGMNNVIKEEDLGDEALGGDFPVSPGLQADKSKGSNGVIEEGRFPGSGNQIPDSSPILGQSNGGDEELGGDFPEPNPAADAISSISGGSNAISTVNGAGLGGIRPQGSPFSPTTPAGPQLRPVPVVRPSTQTKPTLPSVDEDGAFGGGIDEIPGFPSRETSGNSLPPSRNPLIDDTSLIISPLPDTTLILDNEDIDGGIHVVGALKPAIAISGSRGVTPFLPPRRQQPSPGAGQGAVPPFFIDVPQLPGEVSPPRASGADGELQQPGRPLRVEEEQPSSDKDGDTTGGDFPSLEFRGAFGRPNGTNPTENVTSSTLIPDTTTEAHQTAEISLNEASPATDAAQLGSTDESKTDSETDPGRTDGQFQAGLLRRRATVAQVQRVNKPMIVFPGRR